MGCTTWWFTNFSRVRLHKIVSMKKTVVLDDGGKFYPLKQSMFVRVQNPS